MSAPVALCVIAKDEAATIEAAIRSARPYVTEVCVLDTGSTDSTLEILGRIATEPGAPIRVERTDWRGFAPAREEAFAMSALDWLMWLDADELLSGGEHLQRLLWAADGVGVDLVKAVLINQGAPGEPSSTYFRERVMRRGTGRWQGLAHARWSTRLEPSLFAHPAAFQVTHVRPLSAAVRWIPLGLQSAQLHPDGLVELGVDLYESGDLNAAADVLAGYLTTVSPTSFDPAQATALIWLARAFRQLGRIDEADDVDLAYARYRQSWREATWRGEAPDLDRINTLDSISPALLTMRGADPVLGVA